MIKKVNFNSVLNVYMKNIIKEKINKIEIMLIKKKQELHGQINYEKNE